MPLFKDQMQRLIVVPEQPRKIISLVPSQTELLYSLGLDQEVVGITKFCVHPPHWLKEKRIIGGTKNFHIKRIRELQPDLIIGNKEENYQEGIESLQHEFSVWMSDISSFNDALNMIDQVGKLTGCLDEKDQILGKIQKGFSQLKPLPQREDPLSYLYFIWRDPYMAAGANTFINEVLELCGLQNLLSAHSRYPHLSTAEIKDLHPRLILLSSEPYPFKEKHMEEIKNLCPEAEVVLVDGEMFSWYGSRLIEAAPYLQRFLQDLRLRFEI